jgi:cellulose synthase/poly-beta-1,6-N-acetylglucosamine synthase-like glycosyltransferase
MFDAGSVVFAFATTTGLLLVLCSIIELIEIADLLIHWLNTGQHRWMDYSDENGSIPFQPFVSLHVPLCSEPVDVVSDTLRALAAMKYKNFEVIVVYNNTDDKDLWSPIEELCDSLGERFKFYFVRTLSGFKAGALNFALRHTSSSAQIIGIIDSDYILDQDYLIDIAPLFSNPQLGFVQTPQNYRAPILTWFSSACYWEYWQFFEVGMSLRSLRNAPMLHGTMSLIRKSALLEVGGWAEWCLTEDSELGLRLLSHGYQGLYVKMTYGRGLLPFSYSHYKRQRWRWVAGGAQQIIYHFYKSNISRSLSLIQSLHHLQSWIPWIRDSIIVISLPLLGLSTISLLLGLTSSYPLWFLGLGILFVILHHLLRQAIICRRRLHLSWPETLGATCAVSSLTLTVGTAWLLVCLGKKTPFVVTPKRPSLFRRWWIEVEFELAVGAYLLLLVLFLLLQHAAASAVPAMYLLLIAPAYALAIGSGKAGPALSSGPAATSARMQKMLEQGRYRMSHYGAIPIDRADSAPASSNVGGSR